MKVVQIYKYKKDNLLYIGKNVPDKAEILESMNMLLSEKGFELVRSSDEKHFGNSIVLKDGDSQENYVEIKRRLRDAE